MTQFLRCRNLLAFALLGVMLFLVSTPAGAAQAPRVILHLKGGDQVSGSVVSESATHVVISNAWTKALSIPLSEISKRETVPPPQTVKAAPAPAKKPAPTVAKQAPTPPKKPVARPPKPKAVAAAKPPPKPHHKPKGIWHGQVNLGFDAIFGPRDQKSYSGSGKLTYVLPYKSEPKKFFRNTLQASAEYQRTDGEESANHARGSNKTDFDLWDKSYAYAMAGAGYDDVRKIDLEFQAGPGAGVHIFQRKNFVLDAEGGLNYDYQERRDAPNLETFDFRVAEDLTWEIRKNLKLTENAAFYPDMENMGNYRADFTSTLSYGFWEYLSLNLTVVDRYNTELSPGVTPNQFEVRSSLGFTF